MKTGVLLPHEVVTRSLKIDNQAEAMRAVEVSLIDAFKKSSLKTRKKELTQKGLKSGCSR